MAATETRSTSRRARRVIVVGAGAAGLSAALAACEARVPVLLVSLGPARRSPSVALQGGIAVASGDDGDDARAHFDEVVAAGGFRAEQPPLLGMCEAAPRIVDLLDRMGVPFARTPEGRVALRRSVGSLRRRAAHAGATTGQHVVQALDDQLRRWEGADVTDERGLGIAGEKMLQRLEGWELLSLVRDDDGVVVGIVAQELRTLRIKAFPGDVVCLATGGAGVVFGRAATASREATGAAAVAAFRQGAVLANAELLQLCPTAFDTADGAHPLGGCVRAAGGRVWLAKDPKDTRRPAEIAERERDYLLERLLPRLGNLAKDDEAARALLRAGADCADGARAYLDVTHLDARGIGSALASLFAHYTALSGENPLRQPARVAPALAGTLGGLWVDFEARTDGSIVRGSPRNHATSLPGLYAAGEVACQYSGACRLEDDVLLACAYSGGLAAGAMASYRDARAKSAFDLPISIFERAESSEQQSFDALLARGDDGAENVFSLHDELGTALRPLWAAEARPSAPALIAKLAEIEERLPSVRIAATGSRSNPDAEQARRLGAMLLLARVIVASTDARSDAGKEPRTTLAAHGGPGTVKIVHEVEYQCAGQRVRRSDAVDTRLATSSTAQ